MNAILASAAAIREHAGNVPAPTLEHYRGAMIAALSEKISAMLPNISASNLRKLENVRQSVREGKEDASLRVMAAMGVPPDFFSRKVRGGDDMFNVYAIPKAFTVARLTLSDSPLYGSKGEGATLRGTIQGLIEGVHTGGKISLATYLNDYMNERGAGKIPGTYSSGNTQASSSCHALAAMGLLEVPQQGKYVIPHDMARNALLRLLGREEEGVHGDTAPDASNPLEAPQNAPSGKGNKGKGKCTPKSKAAPTAAE